MFIKKKEKKLSLPHTAKTTPHLPLKKTKKTQKLTSPSIKKFI